MKILVTGAGGLVGTAFIREMMEQPNAEIYALTSGFKVLPSQNVKVILYKDLEEILVTNKIDVMVHLAFPRNVKDTEWAYGIEYSMHLIELARKYGVKKILHISSQSLYGWNRIGVAKETDNVILNSPYTTGKYCIEVMVNSLFDSGSATNIRLASVISPATQERLTNKFLYNVIEKRDINIIGGNQVFSFLDVRDVAQALRRIVCAHEREWQRCYNLGTEEYHSIEEIANLVIECGRSFGFDESKINIQKNDTWMNNRLDCSKMFLDFGWKAKYTLKESIVEMFKYIRN